LELFFNLTAILRAEYAGVFCIGRLEPLTTERRLIAREMASNVMVKFWSKLASPRSRFSSSLAAILAGQAASASIALLAEIIYARVLGPVVRGQISLCLMSIAFATLVASLGGEGTIVYWASRSRKVNPSWFVAVSAWGGLGCAISGVLWSLVFWRFRLPFLRGMSGSSARLVLISIPAASLFAYAMALASGFEQFRLRSATATLRQVMSVMCLVLLLPFTGRNVNPVLWGNLTGLLAASVATLCVLWPNLSGPWKLADAIQELKPTLAYGVRGQVGNVATFFTYRLDVFIVNYFLDSAQLGLYALGVAVSEALWQIPSAVASALFPRTARTINQDATPFTCFALRQVLLTTSVAALAVALLSPLVIPLVFGSRFGPSVPVIWWILPGTVALALGKVACADLAGRGKNGYSSVFAFLCLVVTAGLDWFLIPRMGIIGASLASSVAYSLDACLVLVALRYELQVSWKVMLLPTWSDLLAYRVLWRRLKIASGLGSGQNPADSMYSFPET